MKRGLVISVVLALCFSVISNAQSDTVVVADAAADTLAVADTSMMSAEDVMKMLTSPKADTVKKVVDRGRDVSAYVNVRRQRTTDFSSFRSGSFMDNTFVSLRGTTFKLVPDDYSFGIGGGLSFGKWLHQDHAVRLDLDYARWSENEDASPVTNLEIGASYLFNLSSYVGGYKSSRFCEASLVAGVAYANTNLVRTSPQSGKEYRSTGHSFEGHVGLNLNLRLFKDISLFVEPQAAIYTNGVALYYTGNWRRWMAAFKGSVGLTYNIRQSSVEDSPNLLPRGEGWFISLMGGPHFQNSDLVYGAVGLAKAMGIHMGLSIGKYYTDYFAFRYTAAYSRGSWVHYNDKEMPCNYFAVRAEGMLDVVGLVRHAMGKSDGRPLCAASLLFGPELGYMYKVDRDLVINTPYMGLSGGVQAKVNITRRFSLFLEPRFFVLPYDAPSHDLTIVNDYRNYYDGLFNFNVGIEFML